MHPAKDLESLLLAGHLNVYDLQEETLDHGLKVPVTGQSHYHNWVLAIPVEEFLDLHVKSREQSQIFVALVVYAKYL